MPRACGSTELRRRPPPPPPRAAKYVLQACPGTLSNTVQCVPGVNSTSHKRQAGKYECCACRRTRHGQNLSWAYESVQTNSYYGYEPNCNAPSRSLPGDVIVAYTGARMMGNIRRGCKGEAYAEVLLPVGGAGGCGYRADAPAGHPASSMAAGQGQPARAAHPVPVSATQAHGRNLSFISSGILCRTVPGRAVPCRAV